MSEYRSTCDLGELAQRVKLARSVAVVSHSRPDGDAAGSILAVSRALRLLGTRVDAIFTGAVDPNILALAEAGEVRLDTAGPIDPLVELAIVVDTGSQSQLEPLDVWLRGMGDRVLGIDHHARGEDIARHRVVDTSAASTTQIVTRLMDLLGVDVRSAGPGCRRTIAEALFVGLATDTGWFRYQSADAAVFALASRLLDAGVDRIALYQALEENGRVPRLAATARALASITHHAGGRAILMSLSPADFAATEATSDDVGGVVNIPLEIGSVGLSVLLTETKPGVTKASFRSKSRPDGTPWLNVSDFASKFGGGGHALAAGARFACAIDEARTRVADAIARDEGLLL